MDLALHLGGTVEELDQKMSVVEFILWQKYAAARMLPWRRMELYLAQLAQIMAATMGGATRARLSDYLFDPEEETEDPGVAFGFAPHNFPENEKGPTFIDPDDPDDLGVSG
jgi:hypothetical protein